MKWIALTERTGAYELRSAQEERLGGIVIDGHNHGIGFLGDAATNRYHFTFEDGLIHKTVTAFADDAKTPLGTVKLGFTDCGTLTTATGEYAWKAVGFSKTWSDVGQNVLMFLDLEGPKEQAVSVLISETLEGTVKDLLLLGGWYLTIVEYRAGFSHSRLAGMPVKTEDFRIAVREAREAQGMTFDRDAYTWWDFMVDVVVE